MDNTSNNSTPIKPHKLVVVGIGGVGRSSLVLWFTDAFGSLWLPSVGGYMAMQTTFNVDGVSHRLVIDEPSSEYEYREILNQRLCEGDAFLIVYSVTSQYSFSEIAPYCKRIRHYYNGRVKDSSPVPIVLVGNMCDLESERQVTAAEGADLATQLGIEFFEVSAKTGINVENCFSSLVRQIHQSKPANEDDTSNNSRCTLC